MKYKEDLVLIDLKKHVEDTYKEHYASTDGLQVLDIWKSLGNFETSCRDAALKYLFRFGKKNGYDKKDLLKAMHFIMYMYQDQFLKDKKTTQSTKTVTAKSRFGKEGLKPIAEQGNKIAGTLHSEIYNNLDGGVVVT